MAKRDEKTLLFLCTGNYYRSRFAEILFNSIAGKMGLPWKASSRALALERGGGNVGPIAKSVIKVLEARGVQALVDVARVPRQATADDFAAADFVVALKEAEHLPLLQERFPTWTEKVEFWSVDDVPEALALIEREIMALTARLISGGKREGPPPAEAAPETAKPITKKEPAKGAIVRVGRETKGRRGKGVTIVSEVPLDEAGLQELATRLKNRCGTGGTVKDGRIEIQGDQRERIVTELEALGYRVKRVGG
jgi:protein-tyrosine phosphatase